MDNSTHVYSIASDGGQVLGIPFEIVAAIIIPLLVVGLTIWFTRRAENIRKYHTLLSFRVYFRSLISDLPSEVRDQSKFFEDLVKQLKSEIQGDTTFRTNPDLDTQSILELPRIDLFRAMVLNTTDTSNATHHFKIVMNSINKVVKVMERAVLDYKELTNRFRTYTARFNQGVVQIENIINWMVNSVPRDYKRGADLYFDRFDQIASSWQQMDNAGDINVTTENLIKPLQQLCRDSQNDPRNNYFLPPIFACLDAYQNYSKTREINADQFTVHAKSLNDASKAIEKSMPDLNTFELRAPKYCNLVHIK